MAYTIFWKQLTQRIISVGWYAWSWSRKFLSAWSNQSLQRVRDKIAPNNYRHKVGNKYRKRGMHEVPVTWGSSVKSSWRLKLLNWFKEWVKYVISDMMGEHFRRRECCAKGKKMEKFIILFAQSLGFWSTEVDKERRSRFQSVLNSVNSRTCN